MQIGSRVITLQGAKEKSPILLSQYWKIEEDYTLTLNDLLYWKIIFIFFQ